MFAEIGFLIALIVLNGFFAASEIALISLNDNKIKLMAEEGNKKAQALKSFLAEPSKFLATIQIGITLAGFLASAFAAESFADRLVDVINLTNIVLPYALLKTVSVILITIILAYFTLVLGELVPKRLAMQKAESISMFAVRPLRFLSSITSPFVKLLTVSTNFLVKLFGVDPHADEEKVTEEEIRMMVDVGQETGTILEAEKVMINNIFEFDNKTVSDIMTHRTHIGAISIDSSMKEALNIINTEKFTRLPVYEDNIDNVVGILHVKDLIKYIDEKNENSFNLKEIIRKPYFVPASKKTNELFKDLQRNKTYMSVVIDEYGGTAGIVTMEDLIEEIVGNIFDEYDEEEKDIEKIDENTFIINGSTSLDMVSDYLKIQLPIEEYETLSGFLIGQLGRIPEESDKPIIELNDIVFKIEEVDERRIAKVKVCRA